MDIKQALRDQLADASFRKSQQSDNSGPYCVEVAQLSGGVALRDSTDPAGPKLVFTRAEWDAFIDGVRAGEPALS